MKFWFQERSILPRHYTRVPSIAGSSTTSSSLVQDCASNTTLLTNVSPFNSQVALAGDNPDKHYYMENLKSQSGLQISKSQIYSDTLDPLRVKNQLADMREQKEFVPITVDRFEVSRPKINYASQVKENGKEKRTNLIFGSFQKEENCSNEKICFYLKVHSFSFMN